MKRVTFLKSHAHVNGGLEKYTRFLASAFAQQGCTVTLLTTGESPKIHGIQIISLAQDTKWSLYQLIQFDHLCKRWLKKHPQDVIFGMERTTYQTHYRAGSGVHAVFLKRRKMIDPLWKRLTFPINPLHQTLLYKEKKTFEDPHLKILFTNSNMVRGEILNHFNVQSEKIETVHNGVEWNQWDKDFIQSFDTQKKEPFHFLFAGNGYRRKGLLFLLKGLSLIKKKDFILSIVGRDKNIAWFEHWAEKNGLKNVVHFFGPQKDLRPFYKKADALVIPSIYDPFANVTVEALAMGLFVVTSQYNGGKEVLQQHSGAIIKDLTSPRSVASALQEALEHPKSEKRAIRIRESIKHLDFSNQLDKIVSKTLKNL